MSKTVRVVCSALVIASGIFSGALLASRTKGDASAPARVHD